MSDQNNAQPQEGQAQPTVAEALQHAAELGMRATPNRAKVKAIGEAAHYAACADAIRAYASHLALPAGPGAVNPAAWLQIGVGDLHEGETLVRLNKPKQYDQSWWRFEPLYAFPSPAAAQPAAEGRTKYLIERRDAIGVGWETLMDYATLEQANRALPFWKKDSKRQLRIVRETRAIIDASPATRNESCS